MSHRLFDLSLDWSNPKLVVPVILVCIGIVISVLVIRFTYQGIILILRGTKTTGKVIGYHDVGTDKYKQKSHSLIVRVEVDNKSWEFRSKLFWVLPPYTIGDTVAVLYLKSDDKVIRTELDNWQEQFTDSILLGAVAIVLIVLGSLLILNYNPKD